MKKLSQIVFALVCAMLIAGCCCPPVPRRARTYPQLIAAGRRQIQSDKASCILIQYGYVVHKATGKGISPLLDVYNQNPVKLRNALLIDKVIGKAAALIAVAGGVKQVHAEVICESAYDLLVKEGVQVTYTMRVKNILNNSQDDLCPMERAVLNINDPAEAIRVLDAAVAEMKKKAAAAEKEKAAAAEKEKAAVK